MKLSTSDRALLEEMRFNTRDKKIFVRCSVMLMIDKGYSYEVISDSMGISLKSVQRSVRRYEKQGVDGLLRFHYAGRQSRLTTEQEAVLQKELREHLYTSTEQIQALIEEEWGIYYSRSGLRDLLHRLGFVYKKTKILPGKADAWIIRSILPPLIRIEKKFRSRKNQKTSLTIRRMLTPLVNKGEKKDKIDWIWCVLAV